MFTALHRRPPRHSSAGFTLVELVIVLLVLGILLTLVGMTFSGVEAKNRNTQRENDIKALQTQLETYYAQSTSGQYPTLVQLNSADWRAHNIPKLTADGMSDPRWSAGNKHCSQNQQPTLSGSPAANCYAYQVTGASGAACDNVAIACAHYTLTSTLEGSQSTYVKSSLN